MPDPHIITLKRPVGPKGREITELRLREPTAGEVLKASREKGRGLAMSLLSQITGADVDVIQHLPARVSDRALAYVMEFVNPIMDGAKADQGDEIADEITITLDKTIQIGTTWVDSLTLHEPTLGELIKGEKYDGMQRTLVLVALASNLPRAVIEFVPISKFAEAASWVLGFTDAAPAGGGASSDD